MADDADGRCDLARLSAYRDGALEVAERQQVAAHLRVCQTCRETLHDYARLGEAVRQPVHVPHAAVVHADMEARLHDLSLRSWPARLLPGVGSLVSVAVASLVVVMGLSGLPIGGRWNPLAPLVGVPNGPGAAVGVAALGGGSAKLTAAGPVAEAPSTHAVVAPARCAQPLPSVAMLFSERPAVQRTLGCATDAARMLGLATQQFERGHLLWRGDTREVYAIIGDGRWLALAERGSAGQPISQLSQSADGLDLDVWFDQVSTDRPDLRQRLGRAISGYFRHLGLVQPYQGGVALWDGRGQAYLLLENGDSFRLASPEAGQPHREPVKPEPELEAVQSAPLAAI